MLEDSSSGSSSGTAADTTTPAPTSDYLRTFVYLSSRRWNAARRSHPDLPSRLRGKLDDLSNSLRVHMYYELYEGNHNEVISTHQLHLLYMDIWLLFLALGLIALYMRAVFKSTLLAVLAPLQVCMHAQPLLSHQLS